MKRLVIITLILFAATAYITVKYFKNLNLSGTHAGSVMRTIPGNAALVFEFTNEKSFYDIFTGNNQLNSLIGEQRVTELDTVRKAFLNNNAIASFFTGTNVYLSLHPSNSNDVQLLLTSSAAKDFDAAGFDKLSKQSKTGMVITPLKIADKKGYTIYFQSLKKRFYLLGNEENIFSGSFSKDLIAQYANYKPDKNKQSFLLLPDQQNSSSLANIYINYEQLNPLFAQLFKNQNTDIFKSFRLLPALAALNLNYKTDAIMFNGYTNIQTSQKQTYLSIFTNQQPVINHLKEIFPSTTAYALTLAVSDPALFSSDLASFHLRAGLKTEKEQLFSKVKAETGMNINTEFAHSLGNEFAVVNTRYQERLAIISVKDGSKLKPLMTNISGMISDDIGQFNYTKLPYFLLGDAFSGFRKPYFRIIDNYLILANSIRELETYYDTYINRKFLNKTDTYNSFDNLLAERCNVAFFIHFKNAQQILKNELKPGFYDAYKNDSLTWKNFYAASYQLTATDKNFYTNFCMQQSPVDTVANKKSN
ncbi:hypothetical protein FFF34_007405 [Inquilinus sp. KBS0705]|nr:hypothetical protein FFF34_007405 [Inquilinus sp. KBS0705]